MRDHRAKPEADSSVEASSFHNDSPLTTDTHLFTSAASPSQHTLTHEHTHTTETYWASSVKNHDFCSFLFKKEGDDFLSV